MGRLLANGCGCLEEKRMLCHTCVASKACKSNAKRFSFTDLKRVLETMT